VVRAGIVNFPGEWGVLGSRAPADILRRTHRDALWLTLLAGAPGFMQWTYDFLGEYRWVSRIFRALPHDFTPGPPPAVENIAEPWRAFQQSPAASQPPYFMLNIARLKDEDLRGILADYGRSLALGLPLGFTLTDPSHANEPAIRAYGGYQLSYIADPEHRIWLAYLRSRRVRAFGNHFLGVPVSAPLRVGFDLPEGTYDVALIDLSRNKVRRFRAGPESTMEMSPRTDGDYVLIVSANPINL
jgi:hypothetical protein